MTLGINPRCFVIQLKRTNKEDDAEHDWEYGYVQYKLCDRKLVE